jgi:hypothetical protein
MLLFKNGKLKISGGSAGFYQRDDAPSYNDWLRHDVIDPMVEFVIGLSSDDDEDDVDRVEHSWRLTMLNGTIRIDKSIVNPTTYVDVCAHMSACVAGAVTPNIVSAISPFDDRFVHSRRGRVRSIGMKCITPDNDKQVSIRFDHGGHVHFFAFKSIESMDMIWRELSHALAGIKVTRGADNVTIHHEVPQHQAVKKIFEGVHGA